MEVVMDVLRRFEFQPPQPPWPAYCAVLERYAYLHCDVLLGAVLEKLGTKFYDGTVSFRWQATITDIVSLTTGWPETVRLKCEVLSRALKRLDATGPLLIMHKNWDTAGFRVSYIELLDCSMPGLFGRQLDGSTPGPGEYRAFRALFEKMATHRLPAVQIVGRGGQLYVDILLNHPSDREIGARLQEILDFAKRKIANPEIEPADAESTACYAAVIYVCRTIERLSAAVWPARDQVYEYMLARGEVVLPVVFAVGTTHWAECRLFGTTIRRGWVVMDSGSVPITASRSRRSSRSFNRWRKLLARRDTALS